MRLKHVKNADKIVENGTYYVNRPKEYKGKWQKVFGNDNDIYVEIGMGKGDFIIENALLYPDINFIGIEMYDSVLMRAIQKSNDLELSNLKLIKLDATYIEEIFDEEISLIYLNFSDPWPKERHAKRRLTSERFLRRYDKIFKDDFKIVMKTDNIDLFDFSVSSLEEYGYKILYLTRDLYSENISNNIATEYEKKFVSKGIKINKVIASKENKKF